jgi:hypothetical protein
VADPAFVTEGRAAIGQPLLWGRDRIGIGLLMALRARRAIMFGSEPSPNDQVATKSDHLVVCEEGDELAQVIAAHYAYALGAGLYLIPDTPKEIADAILERFYGLYDDPHTSAHDTLHALGRELRERAGPIPIPAHGSITFISECLPYGFAFPEVPSTHLFRYPDLGIAVVNGFAAEQPGSRGAQVAALVNPETTAAPEVDAAARMLASRHTFVRVYEGSGADVTSISEMIDLFPYDLLLIATHCGDVPGHRWTYEFLDSEGLARTLVVDIALGIGRTDDEDMLHVTQFTRFVSLDGVLWDDPKRDEKLYVGTAMNDFVARTREDRMEPVRKGKVSRVIGSAALKMHDNNLIALPRSLASEGTPIIINNACVSWHRLAGNFMFGGARAYVGTLFPISTTEAEEVAVRALGKHYGKSLPHAFWAAQRNAYGHTARRPYVVMGVYPQRIHCTRGDVPRYIMGQLDRGLAQWRAFLDRTNPSDPQKRNVLQSHIAYFQRELDRFRERWDKGR